MTVRKNRVVMVAKLWVLRGGAYATGVATRNDERDVFDGNVACVETESFFGRNAEMA